VQRILRSISRMKAPGKRDFAIVLLLASYGVGAAEVLGLRLEDLDWEAGVLRTRRAKTNVAIELRLLPALAKAISAYLRWARTASYINPVRLSQEEHALRTNDEWRDSSPHPDSSPV
jgi:integrase